MFNRALRTAMLDASAYRDVARDPAATAQALLIFALTTIAVGIAALHAGFTGFIVGLVASFIAWVVYAFIVFWIGTSVFGAPTAPGSWGALFRTLGFANVPRALLFLGFIPVLGIIIGVIALLWTLITTVVAIQEGMRLELGGALVTAVLGWIALFIGSFLVTALL